MNWKISRAGKGLSGEVITPPDKSISHRAIMFGAISGGRCRVNNFLFGEDCLSTLEAFRSMGITIRREGNDVIVEGKGLRGLTPSPELLFLGNSGTTMRLISGILAGQTFDTVLTGDESLSRRPMKRIVEPLSMMGAGIKAVGEDGRPPLEIKGREVPLKSVDYASPVASAQVKSCVLAAGLYTGGRTTVRESFQSRDHTERMLEHFSADIERRGLSTSISGGRELVPRDIDVPGDISSAAFLMVAGLIVEGSDILLRDVGLNPTRIGLLSVLERMGARIETVEFTDGHEPSGDLRVSHSALKGTVVKEEEIPLLIDEIPALVIAAALADGPTRIEGIKELKMKETDRVKTITGNFSRMGVNIREEGNALVVPGGARGLKAASLDSFGDHRIAMSMAVAALVSNGECAIHGAECAEVSYPGFLRDLEAISG